MPLVQTRGAASAQGFGEFAQASGPVTYIEDVFSTYLYTGTGATQTITNGIDLSTKGGLVWSKDRVNAFSHYLFDTVRGLPASNQALSSNTTGATGYSILVESFTSSGFTGTAGNNRSNVAWTFREQAKFFDVVTYTGTGSNTTIAHSLGAVPGSIIVKRTDTTAAWAVYHRSLANTQYLVLDTTDAEATGATWWNSTTPTSSVFSVGTDASVNASGGTYVAYIFAHDAGGFGLAGTDNVISCGSLTADGSGNSTVTLGYEPQWFIAKPSSEAGSWRIYDSMRGMNLSRTLFFNANNANAEGDSNAGFLPNATGFTTNGQLTNPSATYIYIAIRRGPMAVPTLGTSVFTPLAATLVSDDIRSISLVPDAMLYKWRTGVGNFSIEDRLRGFAKTNTNSAIVLATNSAAAETTDYPIAAGIRNTTWIDGAALNGVPSIIYNLKRATSFFDEVCYTGTGSATTVAHNLGVVPELVIIKNRTSAYSWQVGALSRTFAKVLSLDQNSAEGSYSNVFNNTDPTASVFTVGTGVTTNGNTNAIVAYLFATCAGVSKVGSYTGTGTTQTINCGFTAGSRFIMIKRTDSTGDWYVWDSARGIIAGDDPYLLLDSTAAEVTNTDYVDTAATGFEISSTAPAAINANGGNFIFLAIA